MPETTTASRKPRRGEKVKTTTGGARRLACDQVSIIMGSDSDWPTMEPAAQVLTDFNVGFEADV
ncbi:5-(carboxyamino)imidazole ribonucleotide mutase, partial [Xanthomonas citri pv. citri]|nr:5-(carboxyamino)imidazole ribonucleotide mutase [Xanthomonas citri pv. citri]